MFFVVVVVTISLFFILLCLHLHFQALLNKEIKPPFTPEVKGELDTAYISFKVILCVMFSPTVFTLHYLFVVPSEFFLPF